jgi:hypothetical protein
VPNDPGFSLIGRVGAAPPPEPSTGGTGFDPNEMERYLQDVPVGSKLGSHE